VYKTFSWVVRGGVWWRDHAEVGRSGDGNQAQDHRDTPVHPGRQGGGHPKHLGSHISILLPAKKDFLLVLG